jgi:hypothetical protein
MARLLAAANRRASFGGGVARRGWCRAGLVRNRPRALDHGLGFSGEMSYAESGRFRPRRLSMLALQSGRLGRALGSLVAGACALIPAVAGAQEPAVTDPEPAPAAPPEPSAHMNLTSGSGGMDLSTPPPPPLVGRTYHQHQGFYLRVAGGLGAILGASADFEGGSFDSNGMTLNLEVLVGGSPGPGFSIGVGGVANLQLSGDWELEDGVGTDSADMTTFIIGPFADGYPAPNGGWHFGGLLGLASVSLQQPGGDDSTSAIGVGGEAWAGYDFWVAPEWSLGGSLKFDAFRATNSDEDLTISGIGTSLNFTVLYN